MSSFGSEGRSFARGLERESRERAAARVAPSGFGTFCCLGVAVLLALVGLHSALSQRDNGVLPLVPLAIAAAAMLFGAAVFAHAGFSSDLAERVERMDARGREPSMVLGVMHTDPRRREVRARKMVSAMLCMGGTGGLGLAGLSFVRHRKRRRSGA